MTSFENGFLKRAQQAGLSHPQAMEALDFYKVAQAPISGKGPSIPESNATVGKPNMGGGGAPRQLQSPNLQKQVASPSMQSLQNRQTLPMPQPNIAQRLQPMQGPPAPMQMPQPQGPLMPMQGPQQPMQMPQPQLAQQMKPKLAPQMAPGPLRPPTMPQMNQPQLANGNK